MPYFFLTLLMVLSQNTLASTQNKITVPAELEVVQINGVDTDSPSMESGSYIIEIPKGENQLVIKYLKNWNDNEESGMIVESSPIVIRYHFPENQNFSLSIPAIDDYDTAESFSENPVITLKKDNTILSTSQLLVAPENNSEKYSQTGFYDNDRVKTMKKLWQQATELERAEFRQWLTQDSIKDSGPKNPDSQNAYSKFSN